MSMNVPKRDDIYIRERRREKIPKNTLVYNKNNSMYLSHIPFYNDSILFEVIASQFGFQHLSFILLVLARQRERPSASSATIVPQGYI